MPQLLGKDPHVARHPSHHERHRNNYSDLPLWDMVFGTFENPQEMMDHAGFYKGASRRIIDMLLFKDVSQPKDEASREAAELEQVA